MKRTSKPAPQPPVERAASPVACVAEAQPHKEAHSALPWVVRGEDGFWFIDSGPNCVAECNGRYGSSEANARFIVLAVNAHAELVAALRELVVAGRISYAHLCAPQDRTPEAREQERMHVATVTQRAMAVLANVEAAQ